MRKRKMNVQLFYNPGKITFQKLASLMNILQKRYVGTFAK